MIYEIYGQSWKRVFEFRKYDILKDSPRLIVYWRSGDDGLKVRSRIEGEPILLDTENTEWVYTKDDHISYEGNEYKVTQVSKTLHEDHAKVYIAYVKDLGDDEESKQRAEYEAKLYEDGKNDAVESVFGKVHFCENVKPKRKRWFTPWRS